MPEYIKRVDPKEKERKKKKKKRYISTSNNSPWLCVCLGYCPIAPFVPTCSTVQYRPFSLARTIPVHPHWARSNDHSYQYSPTLALIDVWSMSCPFHLLVTCRACYCWQILSANKGLQAIHTQLLCPQAAVILFLIIWLYVATTASFLWLHKNVLSIARTISWIA